MRFLGVLRGECAHCKNNGRGFFNRERILHCKPVNAPFKLVHVRDSLHSRHSLDSNYSTRNGALTNTCVCVYVCVVIRMC